VVGWDTGRLAMILAVLDARAGVGIGASDVYLNVAGGLKIGEPAADLAAAAALVSSFGGEPLPRDTVFFGEISLSGDIRPVPQAEARLKEAAKLGFRNAFIPSGTKSHDAGLALTEITNVSELLRFAPEPTRPKEKSPGRARLES
jgi:DNA repair protein RadA/Sms